MGRRFDRVLSLGSCAAMLAVPIPSWAGEQTIDLKSYGGYTSKSLPSGTRSVNLLEERGGNCRFNRTWGYDLSDRNMWVKDGCSARFTIRGEIPSDSNDGSSLGGALAAALVLGGLAALASRNHDRDRPQGTPNNSPSWNYGEGRSGAVRGQSGLCLDMRGREVAQGTEAIVFECNDGRNQRFEWTSNGEMRVAGMCLDIANNSNDNGAHLIAWPCNGGQNQRWFMEGASIRSAQSGRCLDIFQGVARPQQPVVVWDCNGKSNQRWWW